MEFEFDGTENSGGDSVWRDRILLPWRCVAVGFFFIFVVVGRLVCSPALAKCDFAHAESKP